MHSAGGVVSLNYNGAQKIIYNEFNPNVVNLVKMIVDTDLEELNNYYNEKIDKYGLRKKSNKENPMLNAEGYYKLRDEYNKSEVKDYKDLFLLMCYSMNHLMRFNTNNEFNASNGADAYNEKNYDQLKNFKAKFINVRISNRDVFDLNLAKNLK